MKSYWVYVTAPDSDQARRMGRAVVEERMAACVNILGAMESIYWWDGKLETGNEVALIAKTTADCLDPLIERWVEMHPYECPCIVALPIENGHPPYLEWIASETRRIDSNPATA